MGRLLVVLTLTFALQARADSWGDQAYALWTEVKTTVTNAWNRWTGDNRQPASEQPQQVQAPQPAQPQQPNQQATTNAQLPSALPAKPGTVATAPTAVPLNTTPYFVAPIKGSSHQEMKQVADTVKAAPVYRTSKAGRTGKVPLNKMGVPVFDLEKMVPKTVKKGKKTVTTYAVVRVTDKIPALDIGEEAAVANQDFTIPNVDITRVEYKKFNELKSPEVWTRKEFDKNLGVALVPAGPAIKIKNKSDVEGIGIVTLKKVQDVAYKVAEDGAINLQPVKEMDEEDLKFVRGLMLYVSGDKCHYASGIFFDGRTSKKEYIRNNSRYYLGECLHKMGLFSQAADNLFQVLSSNLPEAQKAKAFSLLTDFPEDYNIEIGQKFEKFLDDGLTVKPEHRATAAYMVAAAQTRKENFITARKFAEMVPDSHKYYIRAQLVMALADYQTGKARQGLDRLKKVEKILPNEPVHKDMRALISLNLARMAFQEKQYDEAAKYYLAIEKNHPLWITGLVEHAWTQLMSGDNEGAIGNMFSLQSTYLKAVYRPESYIVRTIGYLNLCQYADAYKSLSLLEREYRPWIPRIEAYIRANPKPVSFYSTMIRYLTSSSSSEVGGLPYQALREIGRHKDFLNIQEAINIKIDEGEQYKLVDQVAVKDYEKARSLRNGAAHRLRAIEAELKLIAKGKKVPKEENQLKMNRTNERNLIDFYDFQLVVFKEATAGYKKMRDNGKSGLAKEREMLANHAGEILKHRLEQVQKDLMKYFENNEFLRYEVFAGSGENIRFHMAADEGGGTARAGDKQQTARRISADVRPENKDLNWDFQGEFWEDEIGHYKSTLKDNCPQRAAAK